MKNKMINMNKFFKYIIIVIIMIMIIVGCIYVGNVECNDVVFLGMFMEKY